MKLPEIPSYAKNLKICIACLLLSFSATPAISMARGFLVTVDVGRTSLKEFCELHQPPGYSCSQDANAIRLGVGYQFSQYFRLEANYGSLGAVKMNGLWGGANIIGESKLTSMQVAANIDLPITEVFSLSLKLGTAITRAETAFSCCYGNEREDYDMVVYGIGAQYDIAKQIAFQTYYENSKHKSFFSGFLASREFSIPSFTAGIVWKF